MSATETDVIMATRMREAAETLQAVNVAYGFHADWGVWNPHQLRAEAEVLEK